MPQALAPHPARTSAAFSAVADLRPGASLVALILALLLRILARTEAAWLFPQDDGQDNGHEDEYADEYGFDAYAICGADPYALYPRPVGRAPHAIFVEAGLVADWILPGIRNRGMRALPRPAPQPRHSRPARAPPETPHGRFPAAVPSPRRQPPLCPGGAGLRHHCSA